MGYQQGLSGLSGASSDLDVIGNNIANANTVGFKNGQAQFADMYANSVATAVNNQVGIGTQARRSAAAVRQGTITTTNQALDVAINGNGFFQLSNNGSLGVFAQRRVPAGRNGTISNAAGLQLMGYAANARASSTRADRAAVGADREHPAGRDQERHVRFNLNSQARRPDPDAVRPDRREHLQRNQLDQRQRLARRHASGQRVLRQEIDGLVECVCDDRHANAPVTGTSTGVAGDLGTVTFDAVGQPDPDSARHASRRSPFRFRMPLHVAGAVQTMTMDICRHDAIRRHDRPREQHRRTAMHRAS